MKVHAVIYINFFLNCVLLCLILLINQVWSAEPNYSGLIPSAEGISSDMSSLITLRNSKAEVVINHKIGRVMCYRRREGRNLLWVADNPEVNSDGWINYGGSRVWLSPQFFQFQIHGKGGPEPVVDGRPWDVIQQHQSSLVLKSGISEDLGVEILIAFYLLNDSTRLIQQFEVRKVRPSSYPILLWTITQLPIHRAEAWLGVNSEITRPNGKFFEQFKKTLPEGAAEMILDDKAVKLNKPINGRFKIGTWGGWVACAVGNEALLQTVAYQLGDFYLGNSNCQIFVNEQKGYLEIETFSPAWFLREGESSHWAVNWELIPLKKGRLDEQVYEKAHQYLIGIRIP